MVAKGKPELSIRDCNAPRNPARATRMPGKTHAVRALPNAATIAVTHN